MSSVVFKGIFLPLLGTTLGSACVLFMKDTISKELEKSLTGFAAGIMIAASVWSLIVPAIEQSCHMGRFSFLPAVIGFWIGVLFLLILNRVLPHNSIDISSIQKEKKSLLVFAVILHNIPEGMAIGVVLASIINNSNAVSVASAVALAVGIAIQNFPEGSIISMPMAANGTHKFKAFLWGFMSGVVEPVAAVLTILMASLMTSVLPYTLAFAAGAMVYVVVEELIPETNSNTSAVSGTIMFMVGFTLMLALDVALG